MLNKIYFIITIFTITITINIFLTKAIYATEELTPKDDYEKYILEYMGPEKLKAHRANLNKKENQQTTATTTSSSSAGAIGDNQVAQVAQVAQAAQVAQVNSETASPITIDNKNFIQNLKLSMQMLNKVPEETLVKSMIEKISKTPFGAFFVNNPKIISFFVRIIRDKSTVDELLTGFTNKEKYTQYLALMFGVALFFFIFTYIICRKTNFLERIMKRLVMMIFMVVTQFLVFALLFPKSASAMSRIFVKTFF
ncbi:MAG: hypothetical protein HQK49_15480 [Oligoflexia bacterium]|nr:hypothetical protein [Oligoflexia bacterium]